MVIKRSFMRDICYETVFSMWIIADFTQILEIRYIFYMDFTKPMQSVVSRYRVFLGTKNHVTLLYLILCTYQKSKMTH